MATHNLFPLFIKKLHPSCQQQYVYDKSKDEGVFFWLFCLTKICCRLQLLSMWVVQRDYYDFSCKCCLQLKISCRDHLQNGHFLLVWTTIKISKSIWIKLFSNSKVVRFEFTYPIKCMLSKYHTILMKMALDAPTITFTKSNLCVLIDVKCCWGWMPLCHYWR
jgi:hypothetical protein